MNRLLLTLLFLAQFFPGLQGQQSLFDDRRVSSVYIVIDPDSLNVIMTDVLSDHYFMARFVFDDGERRDTIENAGFRLRGNTSRYARKKSFKVSFNEYVPGRRYQGVKKLNLNGQHNDPTMVREKLYYDVWKRAGLPERRTAFARLYINGAYYGLYTSLEEMDKDWLDRVFPDKGGNLYKCTYPADLVYYGQNQDIYKGIKSGSVTGGRAYDLQTNEQEDNYAGFVNFLATLHQLTDTNMAASLMQVFDVNRYLKALALDVGTGNWDNYAYNKNNFFLYDRPDNGKFEYIAYDNDNTFGIDWLTVDWTTRNCLAWPNPLMNLPLAQKVLAVPSFFSKYRMYLDTVARFILDPAVIFPRIDSLRDLIAEAAIADTYRTLDYGYTVADFYNGFIQGLGGHAVYGIKPFLTRRQIYTLQQLRPAGGDDPLSADGDWRLYPNPAGERLNLTTGRKLRDPAAIEILDLAGRVVLHQVLDPGYGFEINTSALSSGLYLLHIKGETVSVLRFFKR